MISIKLTIIAIASAIAATLPAHADENKANTVTDTVYPMMVVGSQPSPLSNTLQISGHETKIIKAGWKRPKWTKCGKKCNKVKRAPKWVWKNKGKIAKGTGRAALRTGKKYGPIGAISNAYRDGKDLANWAKCKRKSNKNKKECK